MVKSYIKIMDCNLREYMDLHTWPHWLVRTLTLLKNLVVEYRTKIGVVMDLKDTLNHDCLLVRQGLEYTEPL